MSQNRTNVKFGNSEVDLIGIRKVRKQMAHTTLTYQIATMRQAYAQDILVAWQGRFDSPDHIDYQNLESPSEFIERFELNANWK